MTTRRKTTILEQKFQALPRSISFKNDIEPILTKAGISTSTFQRDRRANPNSIEYARLQVYAGLLGCEVADLIEDFVKIKPLVKKESLGSKVGLKS